MNHNDKIVNFDCKELRNLQALVPEYDEHGGNSTKIYLEGDKCIVSPNTIKTNIKRLIEDVFTHNIKALKNKYKDLIGRKEGIPLPVNPHLILVPLKYRKPYGKDEGAMGYFSILQIASKEPHGKNESKLIFKSGLELTVQQSIDSVRLALRRADVIRREYLDNLGID